jgi:hypothetical protein
VLRKSSAFRCIAQHFSDGLLAATWPGSRQVEIWNSLPGVEPVERFTSRQVAAARIWKAIQNLQPTAGAQRRQVAPKKGSARNKASRHARPAVRENTKTAKVIVLLQRPEGATLQAIMPYASHCTSLA